MTLLLVIICALTVAVIAGVVVFRQHRRTVAEKAAQAADRQELHEKIDVLHAELDEQMTLILARLGPPPKVAPPVPPQGRRRLHIVRDTTRVVALLAALSWAYARLWWTSATVATVPVASVTGSAAVLVIGALLVLRGPRPNPGERPPVAESPPSTSSNPTHDTR
ncbi:MAG: hypothetical protein ACRET2_18535, partial [Steroidobacteraceae bacterium]